MAPCSADDHDTTDFFCGACGMQLHANATECDYCKHGQHDTEGGYPFCRCCGLEVGLVKPFLERLDAMQETLDAIRDLLQQREPSGLDEFHPSTTHWTEEPTA